MLVKCGGICISLMSRVAHVGLQPHDGIEDRHRLGHQVDDFAGVPRLGEGVDLDELQVIARILAADQAVQRQAHPLDVDVLARRSRIEPLMSISTTVAHLGVLRVRWISMSSCLMRIGKPGPLRSMALTSEAGMSMLRDRVAELIRLGMLQLDGPFAHDRPVMPAGARGLQIG